MSGPKVVRIVTREEIVAICRGHLARVDAAIAAWTKVGQRSECVGEEDIAATQKRRDQLAQLLAADRFMDLQKQAPEEIAYLRDDMQARLAKVAEAQARARTQARRQGEAAKALLAALQRAGKPVGNDLELALKALASGSGNSAALATGFALLSAPSAEQDTARAELAQRLKAGDPSRSFADWLESQPADAADADLVRLERRLAEHEALLGEQATNEWRQRLLGASNETGGRRDLLLDSLYLDLGRALSGARLFAAASEDVRLLMAEATEAGVDVQALNIRWEAADSIEQLEALRSDAERMLAQERDKQAAHARRLAVLDGLASMGYEVQEGMETAWVEQGRMVLRNAVRPDYGVEVGNPDAPRVQMKPVAFDTAGVGPDPSRDRDAETLWCGDVATMQARLAHAGGHLAIEKSLPVGTTPLKRIATGGADTAKSSSAGPRVRARTLDEF